MSISWNKETNNFWKGVAHDLSGFTVIVDAFLVNAKWKVFIYTYSGQVEAKTLQVVGDYLQSIRPVIVAYNVQPVEYLAG